MSNKTSLLCICFTNECSSSPEATHISLIMARFQVLSLVINAHYYSCAFPSHMALLDFESDLVPYRL